MYTLPLTAKEIEERLKKVPALDIFSKECAVEGTLIRVDVGYTIYDGIELKFKSPANCDQVTGLKVYYKADADNDDSEVISREFAFADAHGNNVGDIDHLFAESAVVKVILDLDTSMAFVQNADTNAYLEHKLAHVGGDPIYVEDAEPESGAAPIDADTLGGRPADEYATKAYVLNAIGGGVTGDGTGVVVDQVQADWNQTDETQPDFIKNKPDEMDALLLVAELGLVSEPAFVDANNNVYLDNSNNIVTL